MSKTVLEYPFPTPPEPGAVVNLPGGVDWVRMKLPFQLNHINLWRMKGAKGWTVVDTGYGDTATRELWRGLLGKTPVEKVVVTHFHPDHIGNAGWFASHFEAPVYMTEREFLWGYYVRTMAEEVEVDLRTRFYRVHGLDDDRLRGLLEQGFWYAKAVPTLPPRFSAIRDGDHLTLGTERWRVIATFGHAPEQAGLYHEGVGVFICGDEVLPKISPNVAVWFTEPDADPLGAFLASLDHLANELPGDVLVLPSHGLPYRGLHARIDELRAHHDDRLTAILNACGEGRTAAEIIEVLFSRDLDLFQLSFAMGESIAHLNHLVATGRAEKLDGDVIRFRATP